MTRVDLKESTHAVNLNGQFIILLASWKRRGEEVGEKVFAESAVGDVIWILAPLSVRRPFNI